MEVVETQGKYYTLTDFAGFEGCTRIEKELTAESGDIYQKKT